MSGWSDAKPKKTKPRKKPIAKRVSLPMPDGLSALGQYVYEVLRKSYPESMTCEDLLVVCLKCEKLETSKANERGNENVVLAPLELKHIWYVLDATPLKDVVAEDQWHQYTLKAK